MLQQLSFGGVSPISFCSRCRKPLSNPKSVEAGMGPVCRGHNRGVNMDICKRDQFSDGSIEEISEFTTLDEALVLARRPRIVSPDSPHEVGQCLTNVPHLVVHHSPNGFEFGYAGSGPADLALNVCQHYLNSIGYHGEKTDCFDGTCWSLAWILHQDFKRDFIASVPRTGATISFETMKAWFDAHITDDVKRLYDTPSTPKVLGDFCGNCQDTWPCECNDPVQCCGICTEPMSECRCIERNFAAMEDR